MKKLLFTMLLLMLVCGGYAQSTIPVATLEQRLQAHQQEDTVRVNLLNEISWRWEITDDQRKGHLEAARNLSDKLHYLKGKAIALTIQAKYTYKDQALQIAKDAYAEAHQSRDTEAIFWASRQLGLAMVDLHQDGVPMLEEAERWARASRNPIFITYAATSLCGYYGAISLTEFLIELPAEFDYSLAMKWFGEAKDVALHSKNPLLLGMVYLYQAELDELTDDIQKALSNMKVALDACRKSGNQEYIFYTLNEIAVVYRDIGQYSQAIETNTEAATLITQPYLIERNENRLAIIYIMMGNDTLTLAHAFASLSYSRSLPDSLLRIAMNDNLISDVYLKQHHTDSALYYAGQGYHYALRTKNLLQQAYNSGTLSRAYEVKKDYENAYRYYKICRAARDSANYDAFNSRTQIQLGKYSLAQQESKIAILNKDKQLQQEQVNRQRIFLIAAIITLFLVVAILFLLYRNNRQKQKANLLLQQQKQTIESTLTELKSTQAQLIQSEKMASLGELTAGIAHEIQNPLNFVNNFSEVNSELIEEMNAETDMEELKAIANDIKQNNEKIALHGKRADAIVKGMLQHSRQSKGVKEATNINALCDEFVRLAYHGLRAKDKSFNADFATEFDESIGKINIVPQDMGRVLLNLFNNAFYAVNEKKKIVGEGYKPLVSVRTKKMVNKIEIKVEDNGNGIPQHIIDKIFQPFFTTKPTGQGTGLGLSLAYDIITKEHSGTLKAESKEGEGSIFIIQLPALI